MGGIYQAQLANYPNEGLGITKEDIEANFSGQLTEKKIQDGEERWRSLPENPNERYFIAKQDGKVIGRCIAEPYCPYLLRCGDLLTLLLLMQFVQILVT